MSEIRVKEQIIQLFSSPYIGHGCYISDKAPPKLTILVYSGWRPNYIKEVVSFAQSFAIISFSVK